LSTAETAILDTNVALDCFAFDGPMALPLKQAVLQGNIRLVSCEACVEELVRVLRYPKLKLDEAERAAALERYRAVVEVLPLVRVADVPRCRDRDDQVFLELAAACKVNWLFSRDARVLATRHKMLRQFGVQIVEPRIWAARLQAASSASRPA
jgi:uncharacterized protein